MAWWVKAPKPDDLTSVPGFYSFSSWKFSSGLPLTWETTQKNKQIDVIQLLMYYIIPFWGGQGAVERGFIVDKNSGFYKKTPYILFRKEDSL